MEFEELELIQPILRAVREEGYSEPSPIQQKAIPPALAGRDLLGCAQTGTGKTAAFAIPILQRLTIAGPQGRQRPIRALVLAPTRELALQVSENFRAYGRYLRLRTEVVFGGVSQNPAGRRIAARGGYPGCNPRATERPDWAGACPARRGGDVGIG